MDVNARLNESGEERGMRGGGVMSADMLRVERRHAQTVLTALSSTGSHLGVLLSL